MGQRSGDGNGGEQREPAPRGASRRRLERHDEAEREQGEEGVGTQFLPVEDGLVGQRGQQAGQERPGERQPPAGVEHDEHGQGGAEEDREEAHGHRLGPEPVRHATEDEPAGRRRLLAHAVERVARRGLDDRPSGVDLVGPERLVERSRKPRPDGQRDEAPRARRPERGPGASRSRLGEACADEAEAGGPPQDEGVPPWLRQACGHGRTAADGRRLERIAVGERCHRIGAEASSSSSAVPSP